MACDTCSPEAIRGDKYRGLKEWALRSLIFATVGAAAATTSLGTGLGVGISQAAIVGAVGWGPFLLVALLGAVAGYIIGSMIYYGVKWFTRLKKHDPERISISGTAVCKGWNTGILPPPINDGDLMINIKLSRVIEPATLSMERVLLEPAPNSGFSVSGIAFDTCANTVVIHSEISSYQGDIGAVVTPAVTIGGAVAGGAIAAAVGCAVAGIFTFGLGCLIAILIGIIIGAVAGAVVGSYLSKGIGAIADEVADFDQAGDIVVEGGCYVFSGVWVTDTEHSWNEIHDLESAVRAEDVGADCAVAIATSGVGIKGWGYKRG